MGNGATKRASNSINEKLSSFTSGGLLKNPWRQLCWDEQTRFQLIEAIKEYHPLKQVDVECARILLLGNVNVGKSSFFNTVNSIFRNYVTAQASVGSPSDQHSITTKMRAYQIRNGREGEVLNFKLVDTMGLESERLKGLNPSELPYLLDGHLPDCHQFDPAGNISPEMPGYIKLPTLKDKIHCCVLVLDATRVSTNNQDLLMKIAEMRIKITNRGIPLIVLLTKIDQACNYVGSDVSLVYRSTIIRDYIAMASTKIGIPVSHVLPVKNYTRELELDTYIDVLVLSAIQQMLRFTDNYFDECLVHTRSGYIQPEKLSNDLWTRKATLRSASKSNQSKDKWSSNAVAPPDTLGSDKLGTGTPLNRSLFSSRVGVSSSNTGSLKFDKKLEIEPILEEDKQQHPVKENGVDAAAVFQVQELAEESKGADSAAPDKGFVNGGSPNKMLLQDAA